MTKKYAIALVAIELGARINVNPGEMVDLSELSNKDVKLLEDREAVREPTEAETALFERQLELSSKSEKAADAGQGGNDGASQGEPKPVAAKGTAAKNGKEDLA